MSKFLNRHKDILGIIKSYSEPVRFTFIHSMTSYTLDVLVDTINELLEMGLITELQGKRYKSTERA